MELKRYRTEAWVGEEGKRGNHFQVTLSGAPLSLNTHTYAHTNPGELTLDGQDCLLWKLQVKLILGHVGSDHGEAAKQSCVTMTTRLQQVRCSHTLPTFHLALAGDQGMLVCSSITKQNVCNGIRLWNNSYTTGPTG